jgi:hypothetical protein
MGEPDIFSFPIDALFPFAECNLLGEEEEGEEEEGEEEEKEAGGASR